MSEMTGGQAVAAVLQAEGIDTVFGIIGTHNAALFDALYDCRGVRLVVPRHEQGAAFMADGYARASGRLAACITVPGPGFTNALTGMAQAYSDSSPMLVLAAQVESTRADRGMEDFHELRNSLAVAQAASVYAARVVRVADIPTTIQTAVRMARSGRRRPAYVEIPVDVLSARGEVELVQSALPAAPRATRESLEKATSLLRQAQRPIIYVGGGAQDASQEVLQLAALLQAPVISSIQGKGVVPEDHPLALGDGWGRLPIMSGVLRQADAALVVGARFDVVSDARQGHDFPQALVHLDLDPLVIGRHRAATVALQGDARSTLADLLEALGGPASRDRCWLDTGRVKAERRRYLEERAGPVLDILDALRAVLPRDTIICNDLNLVSYWTGAALEVYEPRTYMYPGGYGCLGFALPAAIGAKIARPERPVVALCGDGGFMYTCQELAVAVQEGLGVVAVVFNDQGFGALRVLQDRRFGGRRIGVDLRSPDFVTLARAFGARGVRVGSATRLASAVEEAITVTAPTVIEMPFAIGGRAAAPPWLPE